MLQLLIIHSTFQANCLHLCLDSVLSGMSADFHDIFSALPHLKKMFLFKNSDLQATQQIKTLQII